MNRNDFQALRHLDDKQVVDDIEFRGSGPNLSFGNILVHNSMGHVILLNGAYSPRTKKVTYNFVLKDVGPICRVDVNGPVHRDKGRTHKHELTDEEDPQKNLPEADARPDLEGKTPRQIWEVICREAKIGHKGRFREPT